MNLHLVLWNVAGGIADPHHFDPSFYLIRLFTSILIWIRILLFVIANRRPMVSRFFKALFRASTPPLWASKALNGASKASELWLQCGSRSKYGSSFPKYFGSMEIRIRNHGSKNFACMHKYHLDKKRTATDWKRYRLVPYCSKAHHRDVNNYPCLIYPVSLFPKMLQALRNLLRSIAIWLNDNLTRTAFIFKCEYCGRAWTRRSSSCPRQPPMMRRRTWSHSASGRIWRSSYIARICSGWSFSGLPNSSPLHLLSCGKKRTPKKTNFPSLLKAIKLDCPMSIVAYTRN